MGALRRAERESRQAESAYWAEIKQVMSMYSSLFPKCLAEDADPTAKPNRNNCHHVTEFRISEQSAHICLAQTSVWYDGRE